MKPYFIIFIIGYIIIILTNALLDYLNLTSLKKHKDSIPEEFRDIIQREDVIRANNYTSSRLRFGLIHDIFQKGIIIFFLCSGIFVWYSGLFAGKGVILPGILFFAILFIASFLINIPFSYYGKFVIEERYGFNTATIRIWMGDLIKELLIGGIISGLLLTAILALIKYIPDYWWIIAWFTVFLFTIFMVFIYPLLIAPLFNKFTPVEGELADELKEMAAKSGVNVTGVFQMDASKRSHHTNAYFTGIGKSKRIVLFDTLIKKHSKEEILAIFAHEIGHWTKRHVTKLIALSQLASFIGFFAAFLLLKANPLYESFGISPGDLYAGLFIIMILIEIPSFLFGPLTNWLSRRYEREADTVSMKLTKRPEWMIDALKKLVKDNLSNLYPHPLYVFFSYSHPPALERIRFIKNIGGLD